MDKIFFGVSVIYALTLLSLYLKDKHGYKPKHSNPHNTNIYICSPMDNNSYIG
jgi:hypothetical protein